VTWFYISFAVLATLYALHQQRRKGQLRTELDQLAAQSAATRRVLEYLQEGAMLLGSQREVLYANPAAKHLLGVRRELAETGSDRVSLEGTPIEAAVEDHRGGTARQTVLVPNAESDGERAIELVLASAGKGRTLLLLRDVQANTALQAKRRDFVANASHELKTPIAALIGLLDLIDMVGEEKREELLERARRNAESLAQMTEDLLGIARAEDTDWVPTPIRTDVCLAIDEVMAAVAERAAKKGLDLHLELLERPCEVFTDPVCFETVLRNLVQNAVNYTEKGQVTVRVERPSGLGLVIEVEDTGPGIDPAMLPRIFERFFRVDPAHSRATGGTGLGLSIVRNLVSRMGGRLAVDSRPGEGSRFRVELPMQPNQPLAGSEILAGS